MADSIDVATADENDWASSGLTDAQFEAFWTRWVANREVALRLAGQFVSPHTIDDIVSSAALLFLDSFRRSKNPAPFPETDDDFRRRFLAIVRNHAIDCVRGRDASQRPVHSHWGVDPEPTVGGRKIADRALDQVFARNDQDTYDAPAPAEQRDKDDTVNLEQILTCHLAELTQMQREIVVETFFRQRKRAEVSQRLGISVNTYDNHLQAAFRSLRHLLSQDADEYTEVDRAVWYDLIEDLRERYEDARVRRVGGKKRNRSIIEGERSIPRGDDRKTSGDGAA